MRNTADTMADRYIHPKNVNIVQNIQKIKYKRESLEEKIRIFIITEKTNNAISRKFLILRYY